jgi:hypothetical protein
MLVFLTIKPKTILSHKNDLEKGKKHAPASKNDTKDGIRQNYWAKISLATLWLTLAQQTQKKKQGRHYV